MDVSASCMSLLLLLLWSVWFCYSVCYAAVEFFNKNVMNLKLLYILLLLLIIN